MANVLIVYGTTEGHTRKIASRVKDQIEAAGHRADLYDSADLPPTLSLSGYDAFILAGSLHQAKHQRPLIHFARDRAAELAKRPSALLSVSLTAIVDDADHNAAAQKCIDDLVAETGWQPTAVLPVAGALLYTQYDWLKRMIMKSIVKKEGGDTDTSRDYEYTDWAELEAFVRDFVARVPVAASV